jgi:hypothetical protein
MMGPSNNIRKEQEQCKRDGKQAMQFEVKAKNRD